MHNLDSTPQHGFFAGAVNANVSRGIFNDAGRDMNIFVNQSPTESKESGPLSKLKPIHQSGLDISPCMDGTRERIFDEIGRWLDDTTDAPNILWITGSPGAGKSAVASSMVSKLSMSRRLGTSFFFRREEVMLSDPAALWRTIAYNLAYRDVTFREMVIKALNEKAVDPDWPAIDLHYKFLIEEPFTETYANSAPKDIPIIVIDALDECSNHSHGQALLDTFVQWSRLSKKFKLIVTGRDDRMPEPFRAACKQVVLRTGVDVDAQANNDIRRFFENRFSELSSSSFTEWPGEQTLQILTERAAGLFIWAETVIKFLDQDMPNNQLDLILNGTSVVGDNLTKLYRQILLMGFQHIKSLQSLESCRLVISAIVLTKTPLHRDDLHKFVSLPRPSIMFVLKKLSSVISIGTTDKRIRINHLSFSEFLCDPQRCPQEFIIYRGKENYNIAMACFKRMKAELKFNVCDLTTSCLRNDEVEGMLERINTKVPDSLSYSCRFWAAHIQDTTSVQEDHISLLLHEVKEFLYCRLLFWLEVMSLIGKVLAANTALLTVIPWIEVSNFHPSTVF
jgi:NACHT domain